MKKIIVLLLLVHGTVYGQFQDDFSDGDFTTNPQWIGIDSLWKIDQGMLNSNSFTTNTNFSLSTVNTQINSTEWRFRSILNFSTSSKNYVDFYLSSDISDLVSNPSGYFLRIGGTEDEISLYRNDGGTEVLLIDGQDGGVPSNSDFNIKVTHQNGLWKVYTQDLKSGMSSYQFMDSTMDNTYSSSAYFGVLVAQSTASFFEDHFFDDFYVGPIVVDVTPPTVSAFEVLSDRELDVRFDEVLDTDFSMVDFTIVGIGSASSITLDASDASLVHLVFSSSFLDGTNTVNYRGMKDISGNTQNGSTGNFDYRKLRPYDVVFNEVMSNVNPSQGLPDAKYIELYNTTDVPIDLSGWEVREEDKVMILPTYTLGADQYVILTSSSTQAAKLAAYGDVLVASYFPTLSVSGSSIGLYSENDLLIHYMSYDKKSYQNEVKAKGGYSLELRDTGLACLSTLAYIASEASSGGTPGAFNSVDASDFDLPELQILSAQALSPDTVMIRLNKSLDYEEIDLFEARIDNILATVLPIENNQSPDMLLIHYAQSLEERKVYEISLSNVRACNNTEKDISTKFGLPSKVAEGDILINEIMYAAPTGYKDWIELYNKSDKIISISDIVVASRDDMGDLKDVEFISSDIQMLPAAYYILSEDNAATIQSYTTLADPSHSVEIDYSLSLNSDDDWVVILDKQGEVIDQLHYYDKWQYELLNQTKGVSLERISSTEATDDKNNWHSASSDVGYSTPTRINSSDLSISYGHSIDLSSQIISPDGDGRDDIIVISYSTDGPDYLISAKLFDLSGAIVSDIIRNESVSTQGFYTWDGLDTEGVAIAPGLYILWVEIYNSSGDKKRSKFPLTVAKR